MECALHVFKAVGFGALGFRACGLTFRVEGVSLGFRLAGLALV